MSNYIDGFVFPIRKEHLEAYKEVSEKVAEIWKEHGAIAYNEFVGADMRLEGTRSFMECLGANDDETIIFGWVVFDSQKTRELANKHVMHDPRMVDLIAPLVDPSKIIFDASRMAYGGFSAFVKTDA